MAKEVKSLAAYFALADRTGNVELECCILRRGLCLQLQLLGDGSNHIRDFCHELGLRISSLFHVSKAHFPFPCHGWRTQLMNPMFAQDRNEMHRLGRGV